MVVGRFRDLLEVESFGNRQFSSKFVVMRPGTAPRAGILDGAKRVAVALCLPVGEVGRAIVWPLGRTPERSSIKSRKGSAWSFGGSSQVTCY